MDTCYSVNSKVLLNLLDSLFFFNGAIDAILAGVMRRNHHFTIISPYIF